MSDQRRQTRIQLPITGKIDLGDRAIPCIVMNLSEGGLAVMTDAQEVPSGPVQVQFRLGRHTAARAQIDAELVDRRLGEAGETAVWSLRALPMELGTRTRVRDLILNESALTL